MGKVILCKGRLAKNAFSMEGSNRKLYSIEELCYFVVENIYGIDLVFFNEELFHFVEEELGLSEVAKELRTLVKQGNGLKDLATCLLCASDLYDKKEILQVIGTLSRISTMESWEKRAHIGYQNLKEGNYLLSLKYFRGILKEEKISEKDYGLILMSMGLCLIHTSSYRGAADCFYKAYLYAGTKESLIYTLLSLKLGGLEEEFKKKVGELSSDEPILQEVDEIWNKAKNNAEESTVYQSFLVDVERAKAEGNMDVIDRRLQDFKKEYREGMKNGLI